jgi:hypothetical protein
MPGGAAGGAAYDNRLVILPFFDNYPQGNKRLPKHSSLSGVRAREESGNEIETVREGPSFP